MRRFGRRGAADEIFDGQRVQEETLAGPIAPPEDRSGGLYRIAVAWHADGHPSSVPAHWGPAYNEAFAEMVAHVRGVPIGDVDLLAEALTGAERCARSTATGGRSGSRGSGTPATGRASGSG
jgi:hypothetical protein